jgi:hypothetical protein
LKHITLIHTYVSTRAQVSVELNFPQDSISFYLNGVSQGVAYKGIAWFASQGTPIHFCACSTTVNSTIELVRSAASSVEMEPPLLVSGKGGVFAAWDRKASSPAVGVQTVAAPSDTAHNDGSEQEKWQIVRTTHTLAELFDAQPKNARVCVEVVMPAKTNNLWKLLVGCVPASNDGTATQSRWIGAMGGLGEYIMCVCVCAVSALVKFHSACMCMRIYEGM